MRAFVTVVKSSKYNLSITVIQGLFTWAGLAGFASWILSRQLPWSRYHAISIPVGILAGLSFDCVKFTCRGLGKVIRSLKYLLAVKALLELRQHYTRRFAVFRTKMLARCSNNSKQCSNNVATLCCAMKIVVTNRSMQCHLNIFKLKFSFCFIDIFW